MVPADGLLLVHVPPVSASVKFIVCPVHTALAPVIDEGVGLMVALLVTKQPVARL